MMSREMGIAAALAFAWVNMDGHIRKRGHGVEKIVPDILGNTMTLAGRHLTVNRNVQLGALAMAYPANRNVIDFHYTTRFRGDLLHGLSNFWFHSIHYTVVHIAGRFPNDDQN